MSHFLRFNPASTILNVLKFHMVFLTAKDQISSLQLSIVSVAYVLNGLVEGPVGNAMVSSWQFQETNSQNKCSKIKHKATALHQLKKYMMRAQ